MTVEAGLKSNSPPLRGYVEHRHDYAPGPPPAQQVWTVPANEIWEPYCYSMQLTTDATAINRIMAVEWWDDVPNLIAKVQGTLTQGASLTWNWNLYPGAPTLEAIVTTIVTMNCPRLVLCPGATIQTNVSNLQAGDQFHGFTIVMRKWFI